MVGLPSTEAKTIKALTLLVCQITWNTPRVVYDVKKEMRQIALAGPATTDRDQ